MTNTLGMQEVSKDTFYATVAVQNVHPYLSGTYPYTSEWRTPSGRVIGKVVHELDPKYAHLFTEHFFVSDGVEIKHKEAETKAVVDSDLDIFD